MGIRRSLLAAVVFGAAAIMVQTGPAQACSCAAPSRDSTPEEREAAATRHADAVFVGEASSSRLSESQRSGDLEFLGSRLDVTFSVQRVVKGPVGDAFDVSTHRDESACGVNFRTGFLYKVFTYEREGRYWTNMCGATRIATEADVALPPEPKTASNNASNRLPVAIALLLAVAGATGLRTWRSRRS